jgi:integrase/recombinase XerD
LRRAGKNGINTNTFSKQDFEKFLQVQKNLTERTIETHLLNADVFFRKDMSIDDFLLNIKKTRSTSTYRSYLCTFKVLFRDFLKQPELIQGYEFPTKQCKPKMLPSKEQQRIFYDALPEIYKGIFLLLASSGLRVGELLNAKIDKANMMILPESHNGSTKHAWISFYNNEAASLLEHGLPKITVDGLNHVFKKVSTKTGIRIYPHLLRSIFAREASKAGVQDRYIDCFCGRTPQSVLARHYSDYSPEVLKEIYIKANIKILV